MAHRVLRLPAVKASTGLSRSSIYMRVADGQFPKPIKLGARAVGWLESDVDAWLSRQIERSQERSK
jgi:prophage regulatory protein